MHLRIVQDKLRKLLCKGPKYREPVSINFSKCKTEVKNSLTNFFSDWCNKKGVPVKYFTQWMSVVMEKVNKKKLKNLKVNLNLVTLNQGSIGDFLFKHFTRTICHVPY